VDTAHPNALLWYASATNVALLRWPEELDKRAALDRRGQPRLLVLDADHAAPPKVESCIEDWIRVPASDDDIRERIAALEARYAHHPHAPTLDPSGQLRFGDEHVFVSPRESAIADALVRAYRTVVPDDYLFKLLSPNGDGNPDNLRAVIHRLRKRVRPLGLTITTVRNYGHILSEAE
jgi:two-component system OmpR family response regulator